MINSVYLQPEGRTATFSGHKLNMEGVTLFTFYFNFLGCTLRLYYLYCHNC